MRKIILITGCSSGIGYYTALTLARGGYTVYASVKEINGDAKKLERLAKTEGLQLFLLEIDITDQAMVDTGISTIISREGRLDIVVNNAGVMYLGPVEQFTLDEVQAQFNINFFGTLRVINAVTPIMRAQQSGTIINISSINGLVSVPLYGIYSSSKFALETLSEVLHFELKPFGINVKLIEPGVFDTNFWINRIKPTAMGDQKSSYSKLISFLNGLDERQKTKQYSLIKNQIHPQKVANTIYKTSLRNNQKLRHIVGLDAKLLYCMRKLLPDRIWFFILSKVYKW